MTRPLPAYDGGKALEDAPPEVKRILSLEFGRNKEVIETYKGDLIRQVYYTIQWNLEIHNSDVSQ